MGMTSFPPLTSPLALLLLLCILSRVDGNHLLYVVRVGRAQDTRDEELSGSDLTIPSLRLDKIPVWLV